jgi:predicted PurR-regulated permease PerM
MADPLIDDVRLPDGTGDYTGSEPAGPHALHPAEETPPAAQSERDRTQRIQAAALVILATAAILSLLYVAKLILVVFLTAVLMSFVLAPVVDGLANFRIPRQVAALFAVLLLVVSLSAVSYLSYARALDFLSQVPEYRIKVQHIVYEIRRRAEQIEKTTETVLPPEPEEKNSVTLHERNSLGNFITQNMSTFSETLLAISFVPFLIYFMLSWQDHVRAQSVIK